MELKINIAYEQVLDMIKQLPANQVEKLIVDAKTILEKEKKPKDISYFQKLLLSAPTMSEKQYETFVENRKAFNQWRKK